MGRRNLTDWTSTGVNSEYYKIVPDLEARIRTIYEGATQLTLGAGIGTLANGEYYFNFTNNRLYVRATDAGDVNTKVMILFTYYQAWGRWGTQTEMANNELFQIFEAKDDYYVRYFKIYVIKKGNPTFTDLKLEIHPELSNYPTNKILATSENTWTNATINSYQNALSEIWFRFNHFPIKNASKYALVLKAQGTFTSSSHVGWIMAEPIYTDGLTIDTNLLVKGPFRYAVVGRQP